MNSVPLFEQLEVLQELGSLPAFKPETQFRDPALELSLELVLLACSHHRGHAADLSGALVRRFR